MVRSKISASLMAAVLAGMTLSGCSALRGSDDDDKRNLERFTAEQIYKRGEYELENSRKPEDAVFYFSEVERLYPYSEWAKRALIMQAYGHHRAGEYEEARGPLSVSSRPIRAMPMRPMRNIFWRCPITTRSTRSAGTRA